MLLIHVHLVVRLLGYMQNLTHGLDGYLAFH
jgi:hypothetical protein